MRRLEAFLAKKKPAAPQETAGISELLTEPKNPAAVIHNSELLVEPKDTAAVIHSDSAEVLACPTGDELEPVVLVAPVILQQPRGEQVEVFTPVLSADTFEETVPKLSPSELQTLTEGVVEDQRKTLKEIKVIAQLQKRVIANQDITKYDQLEIRAEGLEREFNHLRNRLQVLEKERERRLQILDLENQALRLEVALGQ
jgi:hypothetical protein